MSRAWVIALIAAIGAAQLSAAPAHAQDAPPADAAPQVFVDGQPVGQLPPPPADGVRVDIDADSPDVRLVRVDGDRETVICGPPCGVIVPRQGQYQIAGDGMVRTSRFSVPADRPDLQLKVSSGSNGRRWVGIALGVVGYATALIGESATSFEFNANNASSSSHGKEIAVGLLLSGLVVGTVGLVMIFTANTHVSTSSGASFSQASPRGRRTAIRLTPAGLEF